MQKFGKDAFITQFTINYSLDLELLLQTLWEPFFGKTFVPNYHPT